MAWNCFIQPDSRMATDWTTMLRETPAHSVPHVLSELASLNRPGNAGTLPPVTLFLHGGHTVSGVVLAVDTAPRAQSLVVQSATNRYQYQVLYLSLSAVIGVRLDDLDSSPLLPRLIGGTAQPLALKLATATKLEFRRLLASESQRLAGALRPGFEVRADDALLAQPTEDWGLPKFYLERTAAVLDQLLADPLGREALLEKVNSVVLNAAAQLGAQLDGDQLRISIPTTGAPDPAAEATLQAALEKTL